jgi:hypothetical protein
MDGPTLYDEDMHAWALHQAAALRRLKASGIPLPNDLDLDHVAEEIEDLGNEQRFQVESNLIQALIHLIKIAVMPEDMATRHWTKEIRAFLLLARKRWRPSMRRGVMLDALWRDATRMAAADLSDDGLAAPALPATCPFTLDGLLDEAVQVPALVAVLRG